MTREWSEHANKLKMAPTVPGAVKAKRGRKPAGDPNYGKNMLYRYLTDAHGEPVPGSVIEDIHKLLRLKFSAKLSAEPDQLPCSWVRLAQEDWREELEEFFNRRCPYGQLSHHNWKTERALAGMYTEWIQNNSKKIFEAAGWNPKGDKCNSIVASKRKNSGKQICFVYIAHNDSLCSRPPHWT